MGGWICFPGKGEEYGRSKSTVEMRIGMECLWYSDGNWLIRVRGRIDFLVARMSGAGV